MAVIWYLPSGVLFLSLKIAMLVDKPMVMSLELLNLPSAMVERHQVFWNDLQKTQRHLLTTQSNPLLMVILALLF